MKQLILIAFLIGAFVLAGCAARASGLVVAPAGAGYATATPARVETPTVQPAVGSGAQPGQKLPFALAPLGDMLDPQVACSSRMDVLLDVVYETLTHVNEDYNLEPSLARAWDVSPDSKTYTFTLQSNVSFHDGAAWTAAVARANLDRIAAIGKASLLAGYLGADDLDTVTLRVRFDRPVPALLRGLSHACLAMLSPSSLGQKDAAPALFPAGTGPFMFAPGQAWPSPVLSLRSNSRYMWGPYIHREGGAIDAADSGDDPNGSCRRGYLLYEHTGPAYLDEITLLFLAEPAERAAALEVGRAGAAQDLRPADAARLSESGRFWVSAVPLPEVNATADPPALRQRSIDLRRLSPSEVLAAADRPQVMFNAARHEVNCLSYGAAGWDTGFYDTSIRALP